MFLNFKCREEKKIQNKTKTSLRRGNAGLHLSRDYAANLYFAHGCWTACIINTQEPIIVGLLKRLLCKELMRFNLLCFPVDFILLFCVT